VAIIRQHTPVETWIDSDAELLCVQIIGDHSVVVLGLTSTGADMLTRQILAGKDDLHAARRALAVAQSSETAVAGAQ
jgi:hypothetical protein